MCCCFRLLLPIHSGTNPPIFCVGGLCFCSPNSAPKPTLIQTVGERLRFLIVRSSRKKPFSKSRLSHQSDCQCCTESKPDHSCLRYLPWFDHKRIFSSHTKIIYLCAYTHTFMFVHVQGVCVNRVCTCSGQSVVSISRFSLSLIDWFIHPSIPQSEALDCSTTNKSSTPDWDYRSWINLWFPIVWIKKSSWLK